MTATATATATATLRPGPGPIRTGIEELLCLTDTADPCLVAEHGAVHFDCVSTGFRRLGSLSFGERKSSQTASRGDKVLQFESGEMLEGGLCGTHRQLRRQKTRRENAKARKVALNRFWSHHFNSGSKLFRVRALLVT